MPKYTSSDPLTFDSLHFSDVLSIFLIIYTLSHIFTSKLNIILFFVLFIFYIKSVYLSLQKFRECLPKYTGLDPLTFNSLHFSNFISISPKIYFISHLFSFKIKHHFRLFINHFGTKVLDSEFA